MKRMTLQALWYHRYEFSRHTTLMDAAPISLQPELRCFEEHRLQWLAQARGKYALVKGAALAGVFDSENEAVGAGYRSFGNQPFLVKHIVEAELPLRFATFNLGI